MTSPEPVSAAPMALKEGSLPSSGNELTAHANNWWQSRLAVWLAITILGAIADLWTKHAIFQWRGLPGEQPVWWIWEDYIGFQTAVNPGALFGLGAGLGSVFASLSIIAAIGIAVWLFGFQAARSLWFTIAAGCIMAGIFGNLYDRLGIWNEPGYPAQWSSGVRDWILLCYGQYTWPNFNIADSLLVCGTAMLAWRSFVTRNDG